MNELISIIVPVYNVEKYIINCIDSIIKQTYSNIEIILVDDGSTDDSSKICDKYIKIDNRIKVFHKKNGGLSDARNFGIKNSTGKYITFLDSDDDISVDYIEHLYHLIKKYDTCISIAKLRIVTKKNNKIDKKYKEEKIDKINALDKMLQEKEFGISVCAKLFKRELFDDIEFPLNKLYEDNGTTYKLINKCNFISYSTKYIYNYYKRKSSITSSSFNEKKMDLIELVDQMAVELKEYSVLKNAIHKKQIEARFSILRQVANTKPFNEKIYYNCYFYIIQHKDYIFKNPKSSNRQKIAYYLMRCGKTIFKLSWNLYSILKY